MGDKLIVFLCRCAGTIGDALDMDRLAEVLAENPEVAGVETHDLLCGPDGKASFVDAMRRHNATRAVVAACSVREHEKTFQT
jgi:heterodisulfide reductase subunit A